MLCLKEELEKATQDIVQKCKEHLGEMGLQSLLARVETMEEYAERKHVSWDQAAERLANEEAKRLHAAKDAVNAIVTRMRTRPLKMLFNFVTFINHSLKNLKHVCFYLLKGARLG